MPPQSATVNWASTDSKHQRGSVPDGSHCVLTQWLATARTFCALSSHVCSLQHIYQATADFLQIRPRIYKSSCLHHTRRALPAELPWQTSLRMWTEGVTCVKLTASADCRIQTAALWNKQVQIIGNWRKATCTHWQCAYSMAEVGRLYHEFVEQFTKYHHTMPCLWRSRNEDYFNKELKILPTINV